MRPRLRRCLAAAVVATVIGGGTALLIAGPAQAWPPATIKICNSGANSKNIDVDRSASSYGVYSNELIPNECTGNVNDPTNVTIDLSDDGANTTLRSYEAGALNDGIDDGQGQYDKTCASWGSPPNNAALQQSLADHPTDGYNVRVYTETECNKNLTTRVRVCNDAASTHTFDVQKTDGSYGNELLTGECTRWIDESGDNPLTVDVSDDGANTASGAKVEWNYDTIDGTTEREICNRVDSTAVADQLTEIAIPLWPITTGGTGITIRLYSDGTGGNTLCGVADTTGTETGQQASIAPTCASSPTATTEPAPGGPGLDCQIYGEPLLDPGE
jgi:hypothetical protein